MLSLKQLNDVCMSNVGWTPGNLASQQCRYLDQGSNWWNPKCYCLKKKVSAKKKIDKEIKNHIAKCKIAGVNPRDTNTPMGDNCQGYPLLKHIEQGYDKP